MPEVVLIIVGITTIVRYSAGIPLEKFIRGNKKGLASKVLNQFITDTASLLMVSAIMRESIHKSQLVIPSLYTFKTRL